MLSRLKLHHGKKYQPLPRVGHGMVAVGDRVYLWGGWHKLVPKVHSSSEKIKALSVVEMYNMRSGEWGQIPTSGMPPLGVAYHAVAAIDDDIYYFGGRCGHSGCHHNSLHSLNSVTMKWKEVSSHSSTGYKSCSVPMKKAQCGMVAFRWRNEDFLFIFGGYGVLPDHHEPQATYIPKRGKPEYGWTNEAHIYCIQSGSWSVPHVTGDPPPPCSNFSVTAVSDTRALMFGGYQHEGIRLKDVYIAEFGKENVFWTKISSPAPDSALLWPTGTCDHSMAFAPGLYSPKPCPCMVIVGGENDDGKVLSDCWLFDLPTTKWTHVALPPVVARRLYHALSSFTLGPHCVWIVLFGGVAELEEFKDWQEQRMMGDTAVVELMKRDNEGWTATVVLDNSSSNPVPDDYVRKLYDRVFQGRKDWISVATKTLAILPPDEEQARAERAEKRADVAEQEAVEARKLAEVAEKEVMQAKENAIKERKESITLFGDLSDAKKRAQSAELQRKTTHDDLQKALLEIKELKKQLSEVKQKSAEAAELQLMQLRNELSLLQSTSMTSVSSDATDDYWVLDKDDITINEQEVMLQSRTGNFYSGFFRGTRVSVKCLRKVQSLEEYKKVMSLNNKLHHPNIHLFIGATTGDDYVVVAEFSSFKSLNIHLEGAPLSRSHIISLAKDVACALAYLHLHPSVITHGSLSSHTVLIEPREGGWKGKLTDIGFFPYIATLLSAYAAPEVMDSDNLSPSLDIYSYGILLIEMYCRKALGSSGSERDKQLQHINWPQFVSIIRPCLSAEPTERPLVNEILLDIEQLC